MNLFGGLKAQGERVAVLIADLESRWHSVEVEVKAGEQDFMLYGQAFFLNGRRLDPREVLTDPSYEADIRKMPRPSFESDFYDIETTSVEPSSPRLFRDR